MTSPRCYTLADVLERLQLPRRTFFTLRRAGKLPFLEELTPRLGRRPRFRADLVDRYLAGQWGGPRAFTRHKRSA
jgi:hypothetical protein